VSPYKKDRRRAKTRGGVNSVSLTTTKWSVAFYRTATDTAPAREFLLGCPQSVREMLLAIVVAVRDAPPPSFPPSKMWPRDG
jgi:hypothetical protein